jgi:hypothetical protein
MTKVAVAATVIALAACSKNPPPSAIGTCAGNRVLTVNNAGDEAVNVYALNGRTSTEIGTVPIGKKEIVIPSTVRATSFYAVAISRMAIAGSPVAATTDTRVIFVEECRPK